MMQDNGTGSLRSHPSPAASTPCFKIDDGITMPPRRGGKDGPFTGLTHALRSLEVGQSFVAPQMEGRPLSIVQRRVGQLARAGRMVAKFETRILIENGQKVVRVWRVA